MSLTPIDIRYAYAQLGLVVGAPPEQIWQAVANARAHRFATRKRIAEVERFAAFLAERGRLGTPQDSFEVIRRAYHQKAMVLHPDHTQGSPNAEEELKAVNAAYEIIEAINKEAKDYFKRSEETRRAIEAEARATTEREAQAAGKKPSSRTVNMSYAEGETKTEAKTKARTSAKPHGAVKYMAASVPRYIRNKRLFYLGRDAVIGSKLVKSEGSVGLLYDIIMLPEREFLRARLNLGIEASGSPALEMSNLTPAYIPIDTKEVLVPPTETNPHEYAKTHFQKKYGLESKA